MRKLVRLGDSEHVLDHRQRLCEVSRLRSDQSGEERFRFGKVEALNRPLEKL